MLDNVRDINPPKLCDDTHLQVNILRDYVIEATIYFGLHFYY